MTVEGGREAGAVAAPAQEVRSGARAAPVPRVVPFPLVGSHFAAALLFLVAASWGLVVAGPELAQGRYLVRPVVAVTHLLTLGWLTTSIMGALYQLFPVVLDTHAGSERAGYAGLLLHATGLATFAAGMLGAGSLVLLAGAALLAAGLLCFLVNAAVGMKRAPKRDLTWWAVGASLAFLFVTAVLGSSLAGNLRWHHLGADRLLAVGVHMHIALGGWVLLLVIGVARRLLPMFLLSHGSDARPGTAAAVLVGGGALVLTAFHHVSSGMVFTIAGLMLAAGAAAFLLQCVLYVRHSHRPGLDAGLRLAVSGLSLLACAIPLGIAALLLGAGGAVLSVAYGAAVVLAFSLFVAGHYYKIVPFLLWNHRFAPLVTRGRGVPRVADLFSARVAEAAFLLLAAGAVGLVLATALAAPGVARAAAVVFAAGATTVAVQMFNLFRLRPDDE